MIKSTLEHNGDTFTAQYGVITRTRLGINDHGIWTADIDVKFDGGGIGCGGYVLDTWDEESKSRLGTSFGMDQVMKICATLEVEKWEDLPRTPLQVLFLGDGGWGSRASGISDPFGKKVLIFEEHVEFWRKKTGELLV